MLNDKFAVTFIFKDGEKLNHNEFFSTQQIIDYNANKTLFSSALKRDKFNKNRQKSGVIAENVESS